MIVTLKTPLWEGADGSSYSQDQIQAKRAGRFTGEPDPGFMSGVTMEVLQSSWFLPGLPPIGYEVMLPDGTFPGQELSVAEGVMELDGSVTIWLCGHDGWLAQDVRDLFERAHQEFVSHLDRGMR